jgi:TonB family protein
VLVSLAAHASIAVLLTSFVVSVPAPTPDAAVPTPEQMQIPRMVFLQMPGPGGGGGGGGNRQPAPPSRAQAPGSDRITLPVARPIVIAAEPADEPPETQAVALHSVPLASGTFSQTGVPEAPSSLPFSQGPGSGGGVGTGTGTGIGPGRGPGFGPGSGGGFGGGAYRPGNGVSAPTLLTQVRPNYTSEAMRLKIQGTVILDVVVGRDGIPSAIRVARSLDEHGLDVEAVRAVQQWRFNPGRIGETPVDVLVRIVLEFHIH